MGIPQTPRRRNRLRTQHRPRNTPIISCQKKTRTRRPWPRRRHTIQTTHRHRHNGYRLATITIIALLGTATPVQAANNHSIYGGIMVDSYYTQISRCEVNSNWAHRTKSYTGGLGMYTGTAWRYSGHRRVGRMTPRQQVAIADRVAFLGWTTPKGEYVWPVGPFGWGTVRHGCGNVLDLLCKSRHPKVKRYNARACRLARES